MQKSDSHFHSLFSDYDKIAIIGFPKCATTSLANYLENIFPDTEIKKMETMVYDTYGVEQFKDSYSDFKPVIITRDPADRLWSGYYFYEFNKKMPFEDFVKRRSGDMFHAGLGEPIKQSIYTDYTKTWRDLEPIHVTLEDLAKIDDFPHMLETTNKDMFPMPAFYRSLVEKSIEIFKDKIERLEAIKSGNIIPNIHSMKAVDTEPKLESEITSTKVAPEKKRPKIKDDDGTKFNADNYSFT